MAIRRSDRNSSIASLITLNDNFRQAWARFLSAQGEAKAYEFDELLNMLEVASAIDGERSFVGAARELMREYLRSSLEIIESNAEAKRLMKEAATASTTFKYIREFEERERRRRWCEPTGGSRW